MTPAPSLVLDDLRKASHLSKKVDKRLSTLGLTAAGPGSSSGEEDEHSLDGEESDAVRKQRGKRSNHLRSGKTAKITSRICHPHIWPHSELSLLRVSKNILYDDLTIKEFTAGYFTIRRSQAISAAEKDARISHLHDLMYLGVKHEWSSVRDFHAAVLLEIERGHLR